MNIQDAILRQAAQAVTAQIEKDIINTLMYGTTAPNVRTIVVNPTIDETAVDFTYDDAIDKFVYAFMDDKKFTKYEQNVLYDFGQILIKILNIHKVCTLLPLHPSVKAPLVSEFGQFSKDYLPEWYRKEVAPNLYTLNFECGFDIFNLGSSILSREDYLGQVALNAAQHLHVAFVKYLTDITLPSTTRAVIDYVDKYNTFTHYPDPISPSMVELHKQIDKTTRDVNLDDPWVLGSRLSCNMMEEYLGQDFVISDLKSSTEPTGLCIQGGFKGIPTKTGVFTSNGFHYMTHLNSPVDSKEDLIVFSGKVVDNESLAAGLEIIPVKNQGSTTLGVRLRLILYKTYRFSSSYCKFPITYKNL